MPIVSSSVGTAKPGQFDHLKIKVARAVGGDNEPPILAAAGEFLNDAIISFNSRLFECNKLGPTQLTLTDGIGTLPTAFFKELECELVSSTGVRSRQLRYIDWAEYNQTHYSNELRGSSYYTIFNAHNTGQIQLLPVPTATTPATLSYVKITYYRRLALLAEETDILDAPQEIERALVLMAQSDMVRIYRSGDGQLMTTTRALAEQAWQRFLGIENRHPDMKPRFRLAPLAGGQYWDWF